VQIRSAGELYAAFAAFFVTGAVWLVADSLKDSASEFWQQAAATLLMLHGRNAMITLMMLGALMPVHMRYGWRSRKNLVTDQEGVLINNLARSMVGSTTDRSAGEPAMPTSFTLLRAIQ
jgi:hypothetical protein